MGLPDNAKKVFKGILFEVYHWEQKMFDGSKEVFEAVKRKNSVQIIAVTEEKRIVLLREEQPFTGKYVSLPGGIVDEGESAEEAASRELLEETGMKHSSLELWKKTSISSKVDWDTYYFIATGCEQVSKPETNPGEKIKPFKVSFKEFLEEIEKPDFRNKVFADILFRIKHDEKSLEEFRKKIFG